MHQYPTPAPLKTWRCKNGPRRLVELSAPRLPGGKTSPAPPAAPAAPPSSSSPSAARQKPLRLARLNPELVRRLDEARIPDDLPDFPEPRPQHAELSPINGRTDGMYAASPHRASDGLLPRLRGAMGPAGSHHSRRMQGDPLDPGQRDRLLEGLGLNLRISYPGATAGSADLTDLAPLEMRKETAEEPQGHLIELGELRQRCAELEEVVRRLQFERSLPTSPAYPSGGQDSDGVSSVGSPEKQQQQELLLREAKRMQVALRQRHRVAVDAFISDWQTKNLASPLQAWRSHCIARRARARAYRQGVSVVSAASFHEARTYLLAWRAALVGQFKLRAAETAARQDALRAEVAVCEATARADAAAAAAQLAEVEATACRRTAEMEAKFADCERGRKDAEAMREVAEEGRIAATLAQAVQAKSTRMHAFGRAEVFAKTADRWVQLVVLGAWRASAAEAKLSARLMAEAQRRLENHEAEARAEAERCLAPLRSELAEAEAAAAADRELRNRAERQMRELEASAEERERQVAALLEERQRAQCTATPAQKDTILRERDRDPAEQVRSAGCSPVRVRGLRGGKAWAATSDRAYKASVFASWRTAVQTRRSLAALQAKLFDEEARRTSLLKAQRNECETKFTEAEARHRAHLHVARAELAEAEARHADALAAQEAEASSRFAAAEADFAQAVREASAVSEDREHSSEEAPAAAATTPLSPSSQAAASGADARFAEALRVLRVRSEQRLQEAEARHAEALQGSRDAAESRLNEAERHHGEALMEVRAAALGEVARALEETEVRHAAELQVREAEAVCRQAELEQRCSEALRALQNAVTTADAESSGDGHERPSAR
eukprot:gnl/TRDRNA2_/TRDRNA2_93009_c0_seq1.p1 gnl/TRDRNA2_/TRDRNA2_93009_c0~~gnl/TRDRNA2_/TRDRNA2_93009_c0_seq1.p1  ORF type:complete len:846 (-),score=189.77 gnl/TRDRNA2_/TRDRNA2_93009_c0_seq1:71-2608(-)